MASYDMLREIVRNGSNLVLAKAIDSDVIRDLAAIASKSGARLTVTTRTSENLLKELSAAYGNAITFIDGLDVFEQDDF